METETIVEARVRIKDTNVDIYFEENSREVYLDEEVNHIHLSKISCYLNSFEDEDVEDFVCDQIWCGEGGGLTPECSFVNIKDELTSDNVIKIWEEWEVNLEKIIISYSTKLCYLENWQEILKKEIEKGNIFIIVETGSGTLFSKVES